MPDRPSLLRGEVIPYFARFALLLSLTILADWLLHALRMPRIGRWLGVPGVVLIIAAQLYVLRKYKFIATGSIKTWLSFHEIASWFGSLMVLIHCGIHFNAVLPWAAAAALVIVLASGITGKYLLKKARAELENRQARLVAAGKNAEDAARLLFWDSLVVSSMNRWRAVHRPLTVVLAVLLTAHVAAVVYYRGIRF